MTVVALKRKLHLARRAADRMAPNAAPLILAAAIDALPDRRLLRALPAKYRRSIEAALSEVVEGDL